MKLTNKKILLISPSKWGNMHISKHNYSIELAQLGNEVYYLEPAISTNKKNTDIRQPLQELPNLKVITTYLPKWYELLRFKFRSLYNLILPYYIERLLKKVNVKFDIIWCFETNLYSNLKSFKATYSIYHPVDLAVYAFQRKIAATADIVFTISESISKGFKPYNKNVFFINHGLNKHFKEVAEHSLTLIKNGTQKIAIKNIKTGFVGNLFRPELNKEFIRSAIIKYANIEFNIWGPDKISNSNVDGVSNYEMLSFIEFLKTRSNVLLHGVKSGNDLAVGISNMDILLLPLNNSFIYDCSNSHKIIEYLSTGKIIVGNYVQTYEGKGLFEMCKDSSTDELMDLFEKVVNSLDQYNSRKKQIDRIEFALENTYLRHINEIEELIKANSKT